MKRQETIKKNSDFANIIKNGKCLKSKFFNIFYKDVKGLEKHFGLAISKKVGNAVQRNRLKRVMRVILDNHKDLFSKDRAYIIMIKQEMNKATFQELENNLIEMMKG